MAPATERPVLLRIAVMLIAALAAELASGQDLPALAKEILAQAPQPKDPVIAFLEERVAADPDDHTSWNKLGGVYLAHLRERGDHDLLDAAAAAARSSLGVIPAERNVGGLAVLAQVELASHQFAAAAQHARRLMELAPGQSYPHLILADALRERGDYEAAKAVLDEVAKRSDERPGAIVALQSRLGQLAQVTGRSPAAITHLEAAVAAARELDAAAPDTLSWTLWQLAELHLTGGDAAAARPLLEEALVVSPGNDRALASLARLRASEGGIDEAIPLFEQAIRRRPHLGYVAALGDLHAVAGRAEEARRYYDWVEVLAYGHHVHVHATREGEDEVHVHGGDDASPGHESRNLAVFLADHDLKPERAYALAKAEYEQRQDIYTADAVAWCAFKAGHLEEARETMKAALRFETQDAKLHFHAALIARASGDLAMARTRLETALAISKHFDPLQAPRAAALLAELSEHSESGPAHR